MIEPKEVNIDGHRFIISKLPAMDGYELMTQLPLSATPKVGDFAIHKQLVYKLMAYVGVPIEGMPQPLMLTTPALVDNHTKSWESLVNLAWNMIEYNCSFLANGQASTFLGGLAQNIPQLIAKTLTILSQQSSEAEKQPSTN